MKSAIENMYRVMGSAFASTFGNIGVLTLRDGETQIRLHVIFRPARAALAVEGEVDFGWSTPTVSFRRDQLFFSGLRDLEAELAGASVTLQDGRTYHLDDIRDDATAMVRAAAVDRTRKPPAAPPAGSSPLR